MCKCVSAVLESEPYDVVMASLDGDFNAIYSIRCASFTRYAFHLFDSYFEAHIQVPQPIGGFFVVTEHQERHYSCRRITFNVGPRTRNISYCPTTTSHHNRGIGVPKKIYSLLSHLDTQNYNEIASKIER